MRDAILLGVGALSGAIAALIFGLLARKRRAPQANTGREEIEAVLGREIFRARRYQRPFAAVLLARSGAVELGRLEIELRALIRKTDEVGRWDENRLLLVLAESTGKDAAQLLDRLAPALKSSVHVAITDYVDDDATRTILQRLESSLAEVRKDQRPDEYAQQRPAV